MKIEKLSKYNKAKIFISGFVICAALFITINLLTSKSKYKVDDSIDLAEGRITYDLPDLNLMAVYIDDEKQDKVPEMPRDGTTYRVIKNKSYCVDQPTGDKLESVEMEYENGKINISINQRKTKCWVYLERAPLLSEYIKQQNLDFSSDPLSVFETSVPSSGTLEGPGNVGPTINTGMFKMFDYDGSETYYFRGNVEDNYVHFANFYWRIIRINSDGSIRMIYDGTVPHQNGEVSEDRQIGTSAYNTAFDDAKYVGFMYGKETPSTSYKNAVLNEIESDALKELNTWYESHLTNYEKYLEKDAIFCNDRRSVDNFADTWEVWLSNSHEKQYTERNTGGYGKTGTSFGPRMRIFGNNWLNIQAADLSCQLNDSFTPTDAAKGNKAMKHPIGLITLDEVLMGGGFGGRYNDSYYLYTGQFYWTMSPADYYTGGENRAGIYHVGGAEGNYHYTTDVGVQSDNHGIRPVINLKASTTFSTGDGSKEKPFEVS